MADVEESRAKSAAAAFIQGLETGATVDADFDDVWETANVAAAAPEHFGEDLGAAEAFRDDLMAHYYDRWLARQMVKLQVRGQEDVDRRENDYLRSLAAAADLTAEQMNDVLALADTGNVFALRAVEEQFYYR